MNELTKTQNMPGFQAPASVIKNDALLLDIHGADDALGARPIFYSIQQKSRDNLVEGMMTTNGNKQVNEVFFVLLAVSRSRIMLPKYDLRQPKQPALCRSSAPF
jgi:hypothetical protein